MPTLSPKLAGDFPYTRRETFYSHEAPVRPLAHQYHRTDDGSERRELMFVASLTDDTPAHRTCAAYDSRCASCFLGHLHSEAEHNRQVGA